MARVNVTARTFAGYTAQVVDSGPQTAEIMTGFTEHGEQRVRTEHRSGPGTTVSGFVPAPGLDLLIFLDTNGATWATIQIELGPTPEAYR